MSELILVDSSYYIRLLALRADPLDQLQVVADQIDCDYAICGMIWTEVLRGRSDPHVRERFNTAFARMCFINLDAVGWERTARLAWELDRRGEVIPASDLTIAASALEYDALLFTFDRHFARVPGLRVTSQLL